MSSIARLILYLACWILGNDFLSRANPNNSTRSEAAMIRRLQCPDELLASKKAQRCASALPGPIQQPWTGLPTTFHSAIRLSMDFLAGLVCGTDKSGDHLTELVEVVCVFGRATILTLNPYFAMSFA